MARETDRAIQRRQKRDRDRMVRGETGVVTDVSPLTISTGDVDNPIIGPTVLGVGWTPAVDDPVTVLRWGHATVVLPEG